MSIDMTKISHLGSVGLDKLFTEIPKGQAKEGIQFAFKIKAVAWVEGKYGHRYHCDVVIRTLDMQTVLASKLWKVYPSLFPKEIVTAIDTDTYDGNWYLVYTEINPGSKADPPRTRLHYIDTQKGIDAHSGPSKPTGGEEAAVIKSLEPTDPASPSTPLPGHPPAHCTCAPLDRKIAVIPRSGAEICLECGGMVG